MKILALVLSASAICLGTGAERPQAPAVSLEITALKTEVKPRERIDLTVRLTNISHREFPFSFSPMEYGVDPHYTYSCRSDRGREMAMKDYAVTGSFGDRKPSAFTVDGKPEAPRSPMGLAADQSLEEGIRLERACDLNEPGAYTIQLSMKNAGKPKGSMIKSNQVVIVVTR